MVQTLSFQCRRHRFNPWSGIQSLTLQCDMAKKNFSLKKKEKTGLIV